MPIKVGLIIEPAGDHLAHYRRVEQCPGVSMAGGDGPRDLAVISLEPHRMPDAIIAAVKGGAHVLVEKPGCADLAGFERAAVAADRAGKQLMLAMATRLDPAAIEARRIVERGWLGPRIFGAQMHWVADQTRLKSPAYQKSWKSSKRLGGGGKLIFHGIHYIDLLHYLTGDRVERAAAFTANVGGQPIEVEDAAAVSMRLRGGALAVLNTGYYLDRGYSNQVMMWGPEGWLRFEPRKEIALTWYSTAAGAPRGIQEFRADPKRDVYQLMLRAAVDFAAGQPRPFIDTGGSLAAIRTVFAAYAAAESGVFTRI